MSVITPTELWNNPQSAGHACMQPATPGATNPPKDAMSRGTTALDQCDVDHINKEHVSREASALPKAVSSTRDRLVELLATGRSYSAVDIARQVKLAPEGVRRHLDELCNQGLVRIINPINASQDKGRRGRPAKQYELTAQGYSVLHSDSYCNLARQLLVFLETMGDGSVEAFAQQHVNNMLNIPHEEDDAHKDASLVQVHDKAVRMAERLGSYGFTTTVRAVNTGSHAGVEMCQHYCPVSEVAQQFPQLCHAEDKALAEVFGRPVQRLATIAQGHRSCTTFIPVSDFQSRSSNTVSAPPLRGDQKYASKQPHYNRG